MDYEIYDNIVSTRFFRCPPGQTDWWRLFLTRHDENCNRTIGVKVPFVGMIFVSLNFPLRQRPCPKDTY
ncbi:hypothetical protein [Streptomyces sp. NPDC088727]|uniref:hypothetical protein n=1 Tax=Streptomyces sp. NPDC088727 TaxID=3365875 RepID=UPI00381C62CF